MGMGGAILRRPKSDPTLGPLNTPPLGGPLPSGSAAPSGWLPPDLPTLTARQQRPLQATDGRPIRLEGPASAAVLEDSDARPRATYPTGFRPPHREEPAFPVDEDGGGSTRDLAELEAGGRLRAFLAEL
jgi:hypothetical protein